MRGSPATDATGMAQATPRHGRVGPPPGDSGEGVAAPDWKVGDWWSYRRRGRLREPQTLVLGVVGRGPAMVGSEAQDAWILEAQWPPGPDTIHETWRASDWALLVREVTPDVTNAFGHGPSKEWHAGDIVPRKPWPLRPGKELVTDAGDVLRVGQRETVQVAAGTFPCIRIDARHASRVKPARLTCWYSPEVGGDVLVHEWDEGDETLLELTAFHRGS